MNDINILEESGKPIDADQRSMLVSVSQIMIEDHVGLYFVTNEKFSAVLSTMFDEEKVDEKSCTLFRVTFDYTNGESSDVIYLVPVIECWKKALTSNWSLILQSLHGAGHQNQSLN